MHFTPVGSFCKIAIKIMLVSVYLIPATVLPGIAADSNSYNISQSWFKPSLIVNNEPALCKPLLDGYISYFKSTESVNPLEADFEGQRTTTDSIKLINSDLIEVPWKSYEINGMHFKIAEIKKEKRLYFLARRYYSIGWREGFHHDILVNRPIENLNLTKNNVHEYFEENSFSVLAPVNENNLYDVIYKDDPRYPAYESNVYIGLANVYTKNGSVYLSFLTDKPQPNTYMIFELIDERKLSLKCGLITTPNKSQISDQYDKLPLLKALRNDLRDMQGNEGNCGTLHSLSGTKNALENCFDSMIYRPWGSPWGHYLTDKGGNIEKNFIRWGYSGIWNYYKHKSYLSNLEKAKEEVKHFYKKNFLVNDHQAAAWGIDSISTALAAGFFFGAQEDEDDLAYDLERRILDGMSVAELEKELISETNTKNGNESLLTFAISHPELLEVLLKKGLNPNAQNDFGKTPLMYAAQFNMLESARKLLKYGAMTELTTFASVDSCNYTIETKNVSALHYAVRYSSKDFIRFLLNAGAPTYIKDSNGYTPFDYLVKFGGFDNVGQPSKNSYGEFNKNFKADEHQYLKSVLTPPNANKKASLFSETNIKAEKLYRQGKLKESYRLLKRAISLNPENERALSNLALVALKLGNYGESAKMSKTLIETAKSDSERANAYYNLGLACQKAGLKGYHYSMIDYDGTYYCSNDRYVSANIRKDESAIASFLEANKLKPTKERFNTILSFMQNIDTANKKQICLFPENTDGIKSLYFIGQHLYFLIDSSKDVSFKKMISRYAREDREIIVKQKESFQLSDKYKIEKWTSEGIGLGSLMMDDTICCQSFPRAFSAKTKLIEIYTSVEKKTRHIIKLKQAISQPVVLILYGNYIDWHLEGDLSKTVGVYVHGYESNVQLPNSSTTPTFLDNHSAYENPHGSSFNPNTRSVTGLIIDAVFDVRGEDRLEITDKVLSDSKLNPDYVRQLFDKGDDRVKR